MFSLIIVDDELFMANTLSKMLNWNDYGFEVVKIFSNSDEVTDYIDNNDIDVVMTDILMPKVTGIDIARHCFYNHPDTSVIFLSAFSDFEYAIKGIQYKIFSYLTKPVNQTALIQTFTELYKKLNANKLKSNFSDDSSNAVLRNCFIDLMSQEDSDPDLISDELTDIGIEVDLKTALFSLISFKINNAAEYLNTVWRHGKERLVKAMEQIINTEIFCGYSGLTLFYDNGFDVFIVSRIQTDTENFKKFVYDYAENLRAILLDCLFVETSVSGINIFKNINMLKKHSKIINAKKHAGNIIDKQQLFSEISDYIGKHFTENITLNDIAAKIGFNPAYFSSLFKQYYGINFVDYITDIRIKAAKDLLVGTDLKISSIPARIGLSDFSNFSKRFKIETGYSPSEYRKKYRKL